jgi:signal transduction histidine kinase
MTTMEERSISKRYRYAVALFAGALVLFVLYLSSLYNYLLFHSLAEIFSIVVAFSIFIVAWNSSQFMDNSYFLFIGIAYLFTGGLDTIHTLAYTGMNVFPGYDTNLPAQFWIAARYVESFSLLLAPFFLGRKLRAKLVILCYFVVSSLLVMSVFYWKVFPGCFVEGVGLTAFKKVSEYAISLILLTSIFVLLEKRREFDTEVLRLLVASVIVTIGSELAFTFYIHAYGFSNLVGHFLKIISFYLIYRALIRTGLVKPYNLLFRNLKRSEEALAQQALELTRSNAELQQFAYVASHDLQEPLRMVSSYVQLLARRYKGKLDADADDFIGYAADGVERMKNLINDLLVYSRVSTHGRDFKSTDCEAVLEATLANLQVAIEESGTVVTHHPLPTVMADDLQLIQLFQNLIANAIKFHSEDPPRVHISVEEEGEKWVFSVQDNGIGIDPEHADRIFEIFQHLHSREDYPGTGVGLAICKKIVERHGGRIWVDSEPGNGSTFRFTMPVMES